MAKDGSSSQTHDMNEMLRSLHCKECGHRCVGMHEYLMHFRTSHIIGNEIIPGPRSLRNNIPSSRSNQLSARPPRQPTTPKSIRGSNVTPWQQGTAPVLLVPGGERQPNMQEPRTATKWFIGQLDVPIKKVIDEADEVMAKLGLSKVDVSLKL